MGIRDLPIEEQTYENCLKELQRNQFSIRHIPYKLRTKELLSKINITFAIKWVPYEAKTYEMCLYAVEKNPNALLYVPKKYKTEELCLIALEYHNYSAFSYLPKKYKNIDFYKKAIYRFGGILEFFPENEKTQYYCRIAVENDSYAIEYTPEKFINNEFCKRMLEKNLDAIDRISEKYWTLKLCEDADKINKKLNKYKLRYKGYEYKINKDCATAHNRSVCASPPNGGSGYVRLGHGHTPIPTPHSATVL